MLQLALNIAGLFLVLIISISVVSHVELEIILLEFQLKYLFFIPELQPSAVLRPTLAYDKNQNKTEYFLIIFKKGHNWPCHKTKTGKK